MYLFLDSNDSKSSHPQNSAFDFIVELPRPLNLQGEWKCALVEIAYSASVDEDLYVFCDICEYSYIDDGYKPILRIVNGSDIFDKLIYIPITVPTAARIHMYIKDRKGNIPSVDITSLRCTLHIKHGKQMDRTL